MGNFIDKTFTVIADILLKVLPASKQEKQAFSYYRAGLYRTLSTRQVNSTQFCVRPSSRTSCSRGACRTQLLEVRVGINVLGQDLVDRAVVVDPLDLDEHRLERVLRHPKVRTRARRVFIAVAPPVRAVRPVHPLVG